MTSSCFVIRNSLTLRKLHGTVSPKFYPLYSPYRWGYKHFRRNIGQENRNHRKSMRQNFDKLFVWREIMGRNMPNVAKKNPTRDTYLRFEKMLYSSENFNFENCKRRKVTFITISYNNCYPLSRVTRIAKIQFLDALMAV